MTDVSDAPVTSFHTWLTSAPPGDNYTYYEGFLADYVTPPPMPRRPKVRRHSRHLPVVRWRFPSADLHRPKAKCREPSSTSPRSAVWSVRQRPVATLANALHRAGEGSALTKKSGTGVDVLEPFTGSRLPEYPETPSGAVAGTIGALTAVLIAKKPKRQGSGRNHYYHYDVIIDGETIVQDAWEPVFDTARALHAKGITGSVVFLAGKTLKPRLTLADIEKGAGLTDGKPAPRARQVETI